MIVEAQNQEELERKHREGYLSHPVEPGEFNDLEEEQVWPPLTHSPYPCSLPPITQSSLYQPQKSQI